MPVVCTQYQTAYKLQSYKALHVVKRIKAYLNLLKYLGGEFKFKTTQVICIYIYI